MSILENDFDLRADNSDRSSPSTLNDFHTYMFCSPLERQVVNLRTMSTAPVIFREATTCSDLRQISVLNHRTFAEELGQHPVVPSGLLIDRFHDRNRYFIAVQDEEVVGMISAHSGPEFSVARKLHDPEVLKQFSGALEVRLLAIAKQSRNRTVLAGLLWMVYDYAVANGHSHLLISGVVARERMYRKLGFKPLGPAVRDGAATFLPMVMQISENSAENGGRVAGFGRHWARVQSRRKAPIMLLPGPVNIHPGVERCFKQELLSHRSNSFISMFEETKTILRSLIPGLDVVMFPGAGTLANDVVAANLKALFGNSEGLIISNGEFGERLAGQAIQAGLVFRHLRYEWGQPWNWSELDGRLERSPTWVWAVHLETSTGVLNDIDRLISTASKNKTLVALDGVSSLGAVHMPAAGSTLHLTTGVSGKALGAYAGIGIVYLSEYCKRLLKDKTLCASFDLVRMAKMRGPSTTVPSPLLLALREALQQCYASDRQMAARFSRYESLGKFVRTELIASGLLPLCHEDFAAPTITTFRLPDEDFPADCRRAGYRIAHESSYLQTRRWAQIATMGEVAIDDLNGLAILLRSRVQSKRYRFGPNRAVRKA